MSEHRHVYKIIKGESVRGLRRVHAVMRCEGMVKKMQCPARLTKVLTYAELEKKGKKRPTFFYHAPAQAAGEWTRNQRRKPMTGQEFIDKLTKQIMERGKLNSEYTAADLTQDAATAALWYRKPSSYKEQQEAQDADVAAARKEDGATSE